MGEQEGADGGTTEGHKETFGSEEMFTMSIMMVDSGVYTHVKNYQIIHYKYVVYYMSIPASGLLQLHTI